MIDRAIVGAVGSALLAAATPCAALEPPSSVPAALQAEKSSTSALSDSQLDKLRGGDGSTTIITNQVLNAVTSGNVIQGNYTAGNVTISDSALSNFNGLGNLIINTGAQVSLQSGMNVTINTTP